MDLFRKASVFVTACALGLWAQVPKAEVYQWKDARGNLHFTDDLTQVPPGHRDDAKVVDLPPSSTARPIPAPRTVEPPAASTPPPAGDPYGECEKKYREDLDRWTARLAKDRARLQDLNRWIHRSATSRRRNMLQRERVEVKARIEEAERVLREELPARAKQCEAIRYWGSER